MKAVVVGSGGWGTALSMVLCDNGHDVTLWSHDPAKAAEMAKTRENSKLKGVRLPDSLKISGDLDCLKGAELVISATPSFAVRETGKKIAPYLTPETVLVSVSKGIERDTNLRMSQILTEVTGNICKVAALSGPSHAEEVSIRMPTGCVSACPDLKVARLVQDAFMNDYFRVYTSEDIVGVELSAAMKNVVALACGVCDGMGYQGPGLGMVGPTGNFSAFAPWAKLLLSFDMLAGRLEIFPMLLLFVPSTWRGNRLRRWERRN